MKHPLLIASLLNVSGIIIVINFQAVNGDSSPKNCQKVKCQDPPADAKCNTVDLNGSKFPRPSAKNAECCPLWKCTRAKESGFFTFHGLQNTGDPKDKGGSETVRYSSTSDKSSSSPGISNVVSSVATGSHSSSALASDDGSSPNIDDLMSEFTKAFGQNGLKFK